LKSALALDLEGEPMSPSTYDSPTSYHGNGINSAPFPVANHNDWFMTADEQIRYNSLFFELQPENGNIDGDKAREFLLKSGLAPSILSQIWVLADVNGDGALNQDEFGIAMHLVYGKLAGQELPNKLPPALVLAKLDTQHRGRNRAASLGQKNADGGRQYSAPSLLGRGLPRTVSIDENLTSGSGSQSMPPNILPTPPQQQSQSLPASSSQSPLNVPLSPKGGAKKYSNPLLAQIPKAASTTLLPDSPTTSTLLDSLEKDYFKESLKDPWAITPPSSNNNNSNTAGTPPLNANLNSLGNLNSGNSQNIIAHMGSSSSSNITNNVINGDSRTTSPSPSAKVPVSKKPSGESKDGFSFSMDESPNTSNAQSVNNLSNSNNINNSGNNNQIKNLGQQMISISINDYRYLIGELQEMKKEQRRIATLMVQERQQRMALQQWII